MTASRNSIKASDPQLISLALTICFGAHFAHRQTAMYNIFLPGVVLLIAALYQSNARVLSTSSPSINKSPDRLAERDWSRDPESIFIAKDGEGCLNPVSSSKSKRENTNSLYDFSQFFDKTNSDGNYISSLLFDQTNPGDNSYSNVNHDSPPIANDATFPERNSVTTDGGIDLGFLDFDSAGTSPIDGHNLEGSSVAFSSSIPGSPSSVPTDVQRDTTDISQ